MNVEIFKERFVCAFGEFSTMKMYSQKQMKNLTGQGNLEKALIVCLVMEKPGEKI